MNLISLPTFSSPMPLPPLQSSARKKKDRRKGGGALGNKLKKARQKKQAESLSMAWSCWDPGETEERQLGQRPGAGWMHSIVVLILHLPRWRLGQDGTEPDPGEGISQRPGLEIDGRALCLAGSHEQRPGLWLWISPFMGVVSRGEMSSKCLPEST